MKKGKDKNQSDKLHTKSMMQNLFSQMPQFVFDGNREVVIEGSKGVLEYSENIVRINTNISVVCFEGKHLNLRCISPSELIIDGFITKIEFVV
ncbi:MAG: YabP/YqfC family sporulation protein [Ruminococcus sp.]|nr:YabP/YqfC family sporulation protein [Ruminococcus sp.]